MVFVDFLTKYKQYYLFYLLALFYNEIWYSVIGNTRRCKGRTSIKKLVGGDKDEENSDIDKNIEDTIKEHHHLKGMKTTWEIFWILK